MNTFTSYKTSAVTVTPNTNDVTISASGNSGIIYLSDDNTYLTGNYAFEFKLVSFSSDTIKIRCPNDSATSLERALSDLNASANDVIRLENDGSAVKFYVNGTQVTTRGNNGKIKYGLNIPNGESITVTDMKVYPI